MPDPALRRLPPVHAVLDRPELSAAIESRGREAVVSAVRAAVEDARRLLSRGEDADVSAEALAASAVGRLTASRPRLRAVINATGVLLHTGLGRAPLAIEAAEAVDRVVRGYCNLEFDLDTGRRGGRSGGVAELLKRLTGAEAAAVVNNNAAATILALRALATGREAIVSRGELVEIGGSFRLPEIFEVSGVRLREVGTTNKTRLGDYERAIGPETAALLRVHPSNYRIVGFTESASIAELATLGRGRGLFTIDDIGSGALDDRRPPEVSGEPTAAEGLRAGADLVLFSGDKLLGGPQCGLIVGSRAAVSRLTSDPLMRALRVDKMTLAALEATLRLALDPAYAASRIPLWRFLTTPLPSLMTRAETLAGTIGQACGLDAIAIGTTAFLGGGSVPVDPIPSAGVRLEAPSSGSLGSVDQMARSLRMGEPAVVPRIEGGCLILDLRAVDPGEDGAIVRALERLVAARALRG